MAEARKGESELDRMLKQSEVTAFGRRMFDQSEIAGEEFDIDELDEDDVEETDLTARCKKAKSKYMEMFA